MVSQIRTVMSLIYPKGCTNMLRTIRFAAVALALTSPSMIDAMSQAQVDVFLPGDHLTLGHCFTFQGEADIGCFDRALQQCDDRAFEITQGSTAAGAYACSFYAFELVDERLNDAFARYRAIAKEYAKEDNYDLRHAWDVFLAAQRNWLAYRYSMCVVEGTWGAIGPGRDSVDYRCKARLTVLHMGVLFDALESHLGRRPR